MVFLRCSYVMKDYLYFVFSDQKIADQFAVRRMHRWYMPLFRQMIEWSILNTGVELREQKDGKKIWSGLKLKISIAEDLAFLGKRLNAAETLPGAEEESDDSAEGPTVPVANAIRLRKDVCHVPEELKSRLVCRVHKQRKLTRYQCLTCKKAMCLGRCWRMYHTKAEYIFDDDNCSGKVIHLKSLD